MLKPLQTVKAKQCPYHKFILSDNYIIGTETVIYPAGGSDVRRYVKCLYCHARGPSENTEKNAIRAWNRRVAIQKGEVE